MKQVKKTRKRNKDLDYSKELQDIFDYTCQVLALEYPVELLTPEYLILAMLEQPCHTSLIFNTILSNEQVEKLKDTFANGVGKISNKNGNISMNQRVFTFNDECSKILKQSNVEANLCENDEIYTEHVLLALINPKTKTSYLEVFKEMGLVYDDLLGRCKNSTFEDIPNGIEVPPIPPKSYYEESRTPLKSGIGKVDISSTNAYIKKYTNNLNNEWKDGKLDKLIGREKELNEVVTVLARRKKNNCIIVGEGGCGKTTLVYGLVERIVEGNVPSFLTDKTIIKLDVMALISGTTLRGMLEERLDGLAKELKNTTKYVLFIDDIQQVIGESGSNENDTNLSNMLNEILDNANVKVIGTTNFKTYKKHIEPNPSLYRKFQKIILEESSINETIDIIKKSKEYYEKHHNVVYSDSVIERCVVLSKRYITTRSLPDSAFDVLDTVGAKVSIYNKEPKEIVDLKRELIELTKRKEDEVNHGNFEIVDIIGKREKEIKLAIAEHNRKMAKSKENDVTIDMLNECISEVTNIPIKDLGKDEKERMRNIDSLLEEVVIGQETAIQEVARVIKRNSIGLGDKNRVLGSFLFAGSTGVGKSLLAKQLAKRIFGSENSLVKIDMSEYSEKAAMSKLIGTTAGYVGFNEGGGVLTEAIKNKPYCVLLLDEVEKAHPEIYNLFLQLFDEGRLTDGAGTLVNFKNVLVIMTSNVGVKKANEMGSGIGFNTNAEENRKNVIDKEIKKTFSPEFLNRIDKIVFFNSLTDENMKEIIKLEANKLNERLKEIGYSFTLNDDAINVILIESKKQPNLGARPIIRVIQNLIEDKITDLILTDNYNKDYVFTCEGKNNSLLVS